MSDSTKFKIIGSFPGGPVVMQGVWVQSLQLRSHMPHNQKTKTENRNNIVKNSIKTLKMIYIEKTFKKNNQQEPIVAQGALLSIP